MRGIFYCAATEQQSPKSSALNAKQETALRTTEQRRPTTFIESPYPLAPARSAELSGRSVWQFLN